MKKILIVDDELSFLNAQKRLLLSCIECEVDLESDSRKVINDLYRVNYDLVLLDLLMPKPDGRDLLKEIKKYFPNIAVIIVTGKNDVDAALECIKYGAIDYILKSVDPHRLIASVENAFKITSLEQELITITKHLMNNDLRHPENFSKIITSNVRMQNIFRYIEAIAPSSNPVLIVGETGTGKELIAEAIHLSSKRKGNFVVVDVSGLDDNMFSDTLFGHVRGAFTGAESNRAGLIQKAEYGTIFLDEIGDLQESSQIKLLRLLETGIYYSLGSDVPKESKARIIAAINKPLENIVGTKIRQDLYYRLSMHQIRLPSLRERLDDLPLLVNYFYKKACEDSSVEFSRVRENVIHYLSKYDFPGNIRELKTIIYDAAIMSLLGVPFEIAIKDKLNIDYDTDFIGKDTVSSQEKDNRQKLRELFGHFPTLRELNERAILEAMEETGRNQKESAKLLGLSRQAFNRRLNLLKS